MNPIVEGRRLMEELFEKIEKVLQENVLVIADIERKEYASRMDSN